MPTSLRSTTINSSQSKKKTELSPVQRGKQYYDRLKMKKKEEEKLKIESKVPTHRRMTAQDFSSATAEEEALTRAQAWYLAQCSDKTSVEDISDDETEASFDDGLANDEEALVPYHLRSFPDNVATDQKPVSLIQVPREVGGTFDTTSIQPYSENGVAARCVSEATSVQPYNDNLALEEVTMSGASSAASHNTRQKRFTVRTKITYEYTTTFGEGKEEESSDEEITSSATHQSTTNVYTSGYQMDSKLSPAVNYTRSLNVKETMRLG